MTVQIAHTSSDSTPLTDIIQRSPVANIPGAARTLQSCLAMSTHSWVGQVDGKVACVWGLIPGTILSEAAYLWLLTTDILVENQFLFIRHSQRMIEAMLRIYPVITGHVLSGEDRSMRWIKWLGAEFLKPEGLKVPFIIKAKQWTQLP